MPRQKVPITFTYQKTGTNPPIYVAGSFSNPPWQPQEMDVSTDEHGTHLFSKQVMVDDGSEIQYKFRIGPGDWWALDDGADTIKDNLGNTNNILRVSINGPKEASNTKVPNPRVNELKSSATNSGTQTPEFAKTAAEVADSACIIDPETPEPEISDSEAGRIGIRRLSGTPIAQVARTAMEVATVAAMLDIDDLAPDESDGEDSTCPVFSHEFMGPASHEEDAPDRRDSKTFSGSGNPAIEIEDLDFDDPQLEAFPSNNRDSIMAAMRRISTSIEADRTVVDGIPPLPIVSLFQQPKPASSLDDAPISPGTQEPPKEEKLTLRADNAPKRRQASRAPSTTSLGQITEDDELGEATSPFIQHPGPSWGSSLEHAVTDDDNDEGISMGTESNQETKQPKDRSPIAAVQATLPNGITSGAVESTSNDALRAPDNAGAGASSSDIPTVTKNDVSEPNPNDVERRIPCTYESNSSNTGSTSDGEGRSTSIETSIKSESQSDPRKRAAGRSVTPPSMHNFRKPSKYPAWFETWLQIGFVRWIGGFATWLYGRRHRALTVAGTAALVVGVGVLWQNATGVPLGEARLL
ncbi:hypothetical protein F5Y04DRAFT_116175 [Hypomontagnella monticulosa]|nr:hypothetical protein F5Y04DRAFT_116175 [Hypomontagnella monticulosa]